jgi:hypothetical protein
MRRREGKGGGRGRGEEEGVGREKKGDEGSKSVEGEEILTGRGRAKGGRVGGKGRRERKYSRGSFSSRYRRKNTFPVFPPRGRRPGWKLFSGIL